MTAIIEDVSIKDMDITVRAKNVLTALGIHTKKDIYICYFLGVIPNIGTIVKHFPYVDVDLVYTDKVNEEVKTILHEEFHVKESKLQTLGL